MVHIDDNASPCYACKGTRAQYTMPNKGRGTCVKKCLNPRCKQAVYIEAAADVARKIAPSLDTTRAWWNLVYG